MSKQTLPQGWVWSTLGEVANYGKTIKVEPFEIKPNEWVLELEDVEKESSKLLQRVINSDRQSKSAKNRFVKGDVLYGKLRPYLNKVLIADKDGVCTTEIIPITASEGVDARYLFYSLKRSDFIDYVSNISHGLNMPRLGTQAGKEAMLPLAPFNEQKRIADKLDKLLATIDSCKTRLDTIPGIIKRFRKSVLAAATSGKLTTDLQQSDNTEALKDLCRIKFDREKSSCLRGRKPPEPYLRNETFDIPSHWIWTSLDTLSSQIVDGTHFTPTYIDQGIPFISVKDIQNGKIDFTDTKYISKEEHEELSKRCNPQRGDLLITKSGTIGRTAVIDVDNQFSLFVSVALVKSASPEVNVRFIDMALQNWINSIDVSSRIIGTAIKNLHLRDMRVLAVPFPPLNEQEEIVRRVEALFAVANRVEANYKAARILVYQLETTLLTKAFRGQLVPQDANDEPADRILEQIQQQIQQQITQPTKRKIMPIKKKQSSSKNLHTRVFEQFALKEFDASLLPALEGYDAQKDNEELYKLLDRGVLVMNLKDGIEGYSIRCVCKPNEVK